MGKFFHEKAWEDYLYWMEHDKKTLKKINELIKDIARNGNTGIGHPEPLINANGYWSRQINAKDRLVYKVENQIINIARCRCHYDDH
jgi:toxin YoeB